MKQHSKQVHFDCKTIDEKGVVVGYLNNFGNKDYAGDVTMKGAFVKSLGEINKSGRELPMLWQHDHDKPIGVWKNLREDESGLIGEGHINLNTQLGKEAYELAKQGALTGISIGYFVVEEQWDNSTKTNYLKEIDLLETSLVTFPCNTLSRVETVKMNMERDELPTQRELEKLLKESGLSNAQAKTIASFYDPSIKEEMKEPMEQKEPEMTEEEKEQIEAEMEMEKACSDFASLFTK